MAKGKGASRKVAKGSKQDAKEPAATIQSLPRELLSKILALTGRPAAFATVCRTWDDVLRDSSGTSLWENVDLYGSKTTMTTVPQNGGHLCTWLRQHAKSVQSITFHRFRDHQVFISTALGLLSYAPLRKLSFDHCLLNTELLPALRVTTGITHLRLCSLSGYGGEVEAYKLGEALASLPLLGDLEVRYDPSSRGTEFCWPATITTCTRLRHLVVERFRDLPPGIGDLVHLESLSTSGTGLKALPPTIGQLTAVTSLCDSLLGSYATTRTVIPPDAAGLTALQRLALTTMDLPIHLSVLMALTNLSIGHLSPWSQAAASQMQAAVAQMRGLQRLRLHNCSLAAFNVAGLPAILGVLPNLKELRLDGNLMHTLESGDLGPHVAALRKLDLGGSHFTSVPIELQRASGCRHLTLTMSANSLRGEFRSKADIQSSPLLAMPRLRKLALTQSAWDCQDVEAVLNLRQAFDAARHRGGRAVTITCPRNVQQLAPGPAGPDVPLPEDDWATEDEDGYWDDPMYDDDDDPYDDHPYDSWSDDGLGADGYPMY